jgi:type VI secretion system FHA domain protein
MTLVLTTLRCPDGVPPETRQIECDELSIGRGRESDWVLPDPKGVLSRRHCVVARRGGDWELTDTSANGIFVNHEPSCVGRNGTRVLRDGDRLILGSYEIEVALRERAAFEAPVSGEALPFPLAEGRAAEGTTTDAIDLPDGDRFGIPLVLPLDFDEAVAPLLPPHPIADYAPADAEHFRAPSVRFEILPADWDQDLAPINAVVLPVTPHPPAAAPELASAPESPAACELPSSGSPLPATSLTASDAYAAFLSGTGVSAPLPADVSAALRELGRAFRVVVSGLRRIMITRTAIKGEFRIDRTMLRPRGNNPLKFSADDEGALQSLLGTCRHGEMPAERALSEAMRDMRLHELAVSAAMQQATRDLLAALAPTRLERDLPADILDKLPGAGARHKARAWDAYVTLHARTVQALADDFDSVFGKSFVRAYERAMAELHAQDDDG